MNKKGKILSIAAVLFLVLSLVAVVPAGLVGAQNAGVVEFNEDFYSTMAGNNIATVTVEDEDVDVERSGTVRFSVSGAQSFDLTDIEGEAIFQGEIEKETTFTVSGTLSAGTVAAAGTCTATPLSVCTLPVGDRLGDANEDGAYDRQDATYGGDTSPDAAATPTITVIAGENFSSEISVVSPGDADIRDGLPTITVNFDVAPAAEDTITLSYETYEYNIREPGETPIDPVGLSVASGDEFDNATNTNFPESVNSVQGTIRTISPVRDAAVVILFDYNVTDTVESVEVRSDTSGSGDAVTVDLTETSPGSAAFERKIALVTAAEFKAIEDAADEAEELAAEGEDALIGAMGTNGNLLEEIAEGPDGDNEADVPESDDDNVALAERLNGMLGALGLATTDKASDLLALLLPVADGDTITAIYDDSSPAAKRRGTAMADLAPPTINVVEPEDGTRTQDTTPQFEVELTDSGAGIADDDDVALYVSPRRTATPTKITVDPVAIIDGFRIEFLQATGIADGDIEWYVTAVDSVGNSVSEETGGSADDPFTVTIDTTRIGEFDAELGFGVNEGGSERTRSDNTGIQLTFLEPVDGDSVSEGDFDVTRSSTPSGAFHVAQLKNTESTADALPSGEEVVVTPDDATTTDVDETEKNTVYTITEFTAIDANGDDEVDKDDYSVTVDGESASILSANANSVTLAGTQTATVAVTYTFDSSSMVFLTVAAQDDDATPTVLIVDEIADAAGNVTDEDDEVSSEADDRVNPVLTVTLDSDLVGDPDGNGLAEGTITVTSSEPLASDPNIMFGDTGFDNDVDQGDLEEVTKNLVWELSYATNESVEEMVITASGTDSSDNAGTSEEAMLSTDVAAPELASFKPVRDEDGNAEDGVNQGLDNVVRVTSDWGEEDTVAITSTLLGGDIEGTMDVSDNTFAEGMLQVLGLVLAEGDYTWTIQVEDEVGNESEAESIDFTVVVPTPFEITLEPGWNLISVPTRLDAATPGKVFGDESPTVTKIRTWSSTTGWQVSSFVAGEADDPMTEDVDESTENAWVGDILTLKQGIGYWVFSESGANVETGLRRIAGIPQAPRPQTVVVGWNLIGPQFFNLPVESTDAVDADSYLVDVDWSVVYGFDADPAEGFQRIAPEGDDTLSAGSGYWVYLTADGEIVP